VTDPVQAIINAAKVDGFGLQNPFLELASLTLELREHGFAHDRLADTWKHIRDARRIGVGRFRRSPKGHAHHEMTLSHDELLGIAVLSNIFDNGETIKEIIDQGLTFGLYLNGKNEKGHWIDSEWFTYWRPEYRGFMKLAAGRKLNWLEECAIHLNIWLATSWNLKRVRLLFLKGLGFYPEFLARAEKDLGDKYRGRYGKNPLYWNIWSE